MAYFQKGKAPAPDPNIWDSLLVVTDGLGGGMLAVSELDATKNDGKLLKGCPLFLDFSDKTAHIVKSGLVVTGGTTTLPRVNKNHLFKVGEFVYVSGDAVTINAIDTSNAAYDVFTLSAACTGATAGAYLENATAAGAASSGTKGVYTFAMTTNTADGDKFSLDGVSYGFATAATDTLYKVESSAAAAVASVEDAISAQYDNIFSVKALNGKLTFTQLSAGVGAIPVLVVTPKPSTGTIAATISQTTEGVLPVAFAPKYTANCVLGDTTKIVTGATAHCVFRINQWVERSRFPHAISDVSIASLAPNIIIKG